MNQRKRKNQLAHQMGAKGARIHFSRLPTPSINLGTYFQGTVVSLLRVA